MAGPANGFGKKELFYGRNCRLIHENFEEDVNVIDKQNLRIDAIAAAMLMMSLRGPSAFAAGAASPLPVE
ncbi:hypothetical protein [Xanthomonas hyacinthi]|uniref:hypothetical protein n=1 Tax=Xanthomonas hyacinthi TaxID=56455 RepID=UPI003CCD8DF3